MKQSLQKTASYIGTCLETTKFKLPLIETALENMHMALVALALTGICPKCTNDVLRGIKKECDTMGNALREEYEVEINLLSVISENLDTLMREMKENGYNLEYCGTYLAVNN